MHQTPLVRIAEEYKELNWRELEVLHSPPSSLQFSRLVHISRPVLIKGCKHVSFETWSNDNLVRAMGERDISVAITPRGQGADALATGSDGETYFAEPHVEKMSMGSFLDHLRDENAGEILYVQSQNGNIYPSEPSEFESIRRDIPSEITWATEALGCSPDAVNIWIGNEKSVTSVHSDPYENIYTVIRGTKHFTLFPPTDAFRLHERTYKRAQYTRHPVSSQLTLTPLSGVVRWSSITDPKVPGSVPGATPLQVDVRAGETLYLPPGWWHHVEQTGDRSGVCIALNWWYDMEMRGMHWVWLQLLRGTLVEKEEAAPVDR